MIFAYQIVAHLGFNPKTGKAVCTFCHESARTDGVVGDIERLKHILDTQLPKDLQLSWLLVLMKCCLKLLIFFAWATQRGFIINATVNQLTVSSNRQSTQYVTKLIQDGNIKGLGLSFRNVETFIKVPKEIIEYGNTVVHVIAGIDDIEEVKKLAELGVKKVLVLGEKSLDSTLIHFIMLNVSKIVKYGCGKSMNCLNCLM